MPEEVTFAECDRLVKEFEQVIKKPVKTPSSVYYTGVDLGTACVVLAVLDENRRPVAGAYRYADVVRDGMVVDYIGAIRLVREMKEELEEKLGTELIYAAAAIPPGTDSLDGGAIKNVVQGAGFEITALLDEPTAANQVLKIKNGAVVDIGGGTTGISILKDGKVIRVDERGNVVNFVMNDKCAAGTGRFLELMARTLELSMDEMSTAGLNWKEDITISSMCTVFAESEVVSLIAQNKSRADIIHGLNESVASKTYALCRRIGGEPVYMMTGGVSKNQGVAQAIQRKLGAELRISDQAQLNGALGAALFAMELDG